MTAGTCAGAEGAELPTTLVRALHELAGLVGAGELVYLVLWTLLPSRG